MRIGSGAQRLFSRGSRLPCRQEGAFFMPKSLEGGAERFTALSSNKICKKSGDFPPSAGEVSCQ